MIDPTPGRPTPPTIRVAAPLDQGRLPAILAEAFPAGAADYLPWQRWFGDKNRRLDRVTVRDLAVLGAGPDAYALLIASVSFADGRQAEYFVPLAVTLEPLPARQTVVRLAVGSDEWRVVDALPLPRFHGWFLDQLASGATITGRHGQFLFEPTSSLAEYGAAARLGESRVSRAEQSNTSVVYGDAAILKVFRRLQPGLNPDLEIGRVLTERTGFRHAPALLGGVAYVGAVGSGDSVAMLQAFVPSRGDAWRDTLARLASLAETASTSHAPRDDIADLLDLAGAERLGRRTGQLHVALAGIADDPAFAPEATSNDDVTRWTAATVEAAQRRADELADHRPRLPATTQADIDRLRLDPPTVRARVAGYRALVGVARIRVHGDYHLGQVLRTLDGDLMLLDFEGEPARPMEERRRKLPPLVDAAGMLRSFRYARAAALKALPAAPATAAAPVLADWHARTRAAFLAAYRDEVRLSPVSLVPADPAAFAAALAAWEFDKAVYELNYELNNRPDWLDIPLATLRPEPGS